jgi:tetratricopeptide (TPR) repeat protein
MGERARTLCTKLNLSANKHLVSRNHDLLGCIANGTNNPASSMEHNMRLLALRHEIAQETGKRDVLLAYAHNQLGCSLMMANKYEEATEEFQLALKIWRELPEFKPGLPSMEYANLGLAYWMQGKLEEALVVLEQGQSEREEGFGYMDNESFRYSSKLLCFRATS